MNLQIIKSIEGKAEYVLLPIKAYQALKHQIDRILTQDADFEIFNLEDYVTNPVALARIRADLTQEELAEKMGVSQAYISKLESQEKVSAKVLAKVMAGIQAE
jgi:ribosome-binding protein aMBF1 (putative translation factor)